MKLLFALAILPLLSFSSPPCGDGIVYAWEKQTLNDTRFTDFPKIAGKKNGPVYDGGDKKLDRLIREKLVLDEEAQQQVFVLNYYFVVKCDGTIGDVTVLGDPVVSRWTNIANIVKHTSGWEPAEIEGKPVDCIYFRTLQIVGSNYRKKNP